MRSYSSLINKALRELVELVVYKERELPDVDWQVADKHGVKLDDLIAAYDCYLDYELEELSQI